MMKRVRVLVASTTALLASLVLVCAAAATGPRATRLYHAETIAGNLALAYAKAREGAARGPLIDRTCLPKAGCKTYTILWASYSGDEWAVAAFWSPARGFKDQPLFFKRRVKNHGEWRWVGDSSYGTRSWAGLPCPVLKVWKLSCELATAKPPLEAVRA